MDVFFDLLFNVIEEGLVYGTMAMGVYIIYRILGSPDLLIDGTPPPGACVAGALIAVGVNPWIVCLVVFLAGVAAGCVTGLLHVKLHITDLLSGILVMTGLWGVNLVVTRGSVVLPSHNKPTIFTSGLIVHPIPPGMQDYRVVLIVLLVVVVVKALLDPYLKTKSGLLLRASGNNPQCVISFGKDPGRMKIAGPAIGNGCTVLVGSILAQQTETANTHGGMGMIVMALASVIIGTSLFGKIKFIRLTAMVMIGAILYKACLVITMQLGLPTNYLKLLMALLFTPALVRNQVSSGRREHPHVVSPTQT